MNSKKVIVALDVQTRQDFERLSGDLATTATYVKVGMELFILLGQILLLP
jgi:orotidine-5'-phosphate decarboxylase